MPNAALVITSLFCTPALSLEKIFIERDVAVTKAFLMPGEIKAKETNAAMMIRYNAAAGDFFIAKRPRFTA
jgi:hypothetical protein